MASSSQGSLTRQNLHTLDDEGATDYLQDRLSLDSAGCDDETSPMLPPNYGYPNYTQIAVPNTNLFKVSPYYVQQSYDETLNELQRKSTGEQCGLSPVRRMFLLLALFDFLLSFLLWVIYLQIHGNITEEVKRIKFDIRKSYFDVVATSLIRSSLILATYSCVFKVKHWLMVAFTTASSTAYLLVKVFLIDSFSGEGQPLNYMLIIFSFVICWCEAWHFDFHVIPRELNEVVVTNSLPPIVPARPATGVFPSRYRAYSRAGKSSAFFTPYAGSVYRARSPSQDTESTISDLSQELSLTEERDREFIRSANDTVHMVFRMLYINDDWKLEKEERDNIKVYSRYFDGVGKVFKLECLIDVPSGVLDKLFWEDLDSQPSWNASVKELQIVYKINAKTDIVYSVAAEAGAGIISSRDFAMLRRRKKKGPLTILSSVSIKTDLVPEKKPLIRGSNGPGGWVMRDIPGEPNKTEFIWLLNTELKGWLPQSLVEQSVSGVMVDTVRDIRKHVSTLTCI